MSAGERQRIATARAFLTDPAILILDEPTAALDPATEGLVADGYEAVMRGRTVIVITHRAELARRADRIVTIYLKSGYSPTSTSPTSTSPTSTSQATV